MAMATPGVGQVEGVVHTVWTSQVIPANLVFSGLSTLLHFLVSMPSK
jgi:hypothetical protein